MITLSADGVALDGERGKADSFHVYLTKPVRGAELLDAIDNVLKKDVT